MHHKAHEIHFNNGYVNLDTLEFQERILLLNTFNEIMKNQLIRSP